MKTLSSGSRVGSHELTFALIGPDHLCRFRFLADFLVATAGAIECHHFLIVATRVTIASVIVVSRLLGRFFGPTAAIVVGRHR
jgi:hypothetical protein